MSQVEMFKCVECGFKCVSEDERDRQLGARRACWDEIHHAGMETADTVTLPAHDWELVLRTLSTKIDQATTESEELAYETIRRVVIDQIHKPTK